MSAIPLKPTNVEMDTPMFALTSITFQLLQHTILPRVEVTDKDSFSLALAKLVSQTVTKIAEMKLLSVTLALTRVNNHALTSMNAMVITDVTKTRHAMITPRPRQPRQHILVVVIKGGLVAMLLANSAQISTNVKII